MGLRSGLELTLASGAEGHLLQALLAYTDRTLCTESVEFVMDCVEFLQMPEDEWADGPKAKRRTEICNTYIKIGSDKEVNLGAKQRLECLRMVAAQEPACFTEAAAEIRHILISDVWPKFLHSSEYAEAMAPSPTSEALLSPRLRFQKEGAVAFNNMKGRFRYGARTGSRLAAAALAATSKSPLSSPPGSGSWTLTPPLSPPQQLLPSREQKEAATAAKAAKHELQTWLSDEITCDEALTVAGEVQAAGGEGGPDHERWHQAMRNLRHNRRPSRSPMSMGNRTMGHVFNFEEEGAAATSTSNTGMKRRGSWRKKLPFRWGSGGSNGSAEGFKTLARSSSSPGLFALDQAQNDIPQEPEIPVNEPKSKLGHSRRPSATTTAKAGPEAAGAGSSGHKRTNSNGSRRNSFRRLYGLMTLQSNSMDEDDRNVNSNSNSTKGDTQGAEGGAVVNPMSRGNVNGKNSNFKKFEQCKAPPHRPPNANLHCRSPATSLDLFQVATVSMHQNHRRRASHAPDSPSSATSTTHRSGVWSQSQSHRGLTALSDTESSCDESPLPVAGGSEGGFGSSGTVGSGNWRMATKPVPGAMAVATLRSPGALERVFDNSGSSVTHKE